MEIVLTFLCHESSYGDCSPPIFMITAHSTEENIAREESRISESELGLIMGNGSSTLLLFIIIIIIIIIIINKH